MLQEEFGQILEIAHVLPVDRHPHRRSDSVPSQGDESLQSFHKASLAPHGIMADRHGPINGDLHIIAAPRRDEKDRHVIIYERPVAENGKPHAVPDNPADDLFQIFADERLAARKRHLRNSAAVQLLEELKPFLCGQIAAHVARALKVVAVTAAQVTTVRDGDVHRFRRAHQLHRSALEYWNSGVME